MAQAASVSVTVTDGELSDTTSFSLVVGEPPQTGSTITVFATGKSGEETIELEIDGQVEAVFTNVGGDFANGTSQTFTYDHPVPVVPEQVRVLFTNNNGSARDVRIDAVRVDAVTVQSEAGYSEGHWESGQRVRWRLRSHRGTPLRRVHRVRDAGRSGRRRLVDPDPGRREVRIRDGAAPDRRRGGRDLR